MPKSVNRIRCSPSPGFVSKILGRLDIAMEHSTLVCIIQRPGNGGDDRQYLARRHAGRKPLAHELGDVGGLDVVHCGPGLSFKFAAVVHLHDVRVVQRCRDLGFLPESRAELASSIVAAGRIFNASRRGSLGCCAR